MGTDHAIKINIKEMVWKLSGKDANEIHIRIVSDVHVYFKMNRNWPSLVKNKIDRTQKFVYGTILLFGLVFRHIAIMKAFEEESPSGDIYTLIFFETNIRIQPATSLWEEAS